MRPYEVMLILESGVEDTVVQAVIDRARTAVVAQQGTVGQIEKWGRRRFAYELDHRWEGYYVLVEITANPASIAELNRTLSLSDDVIRHKIIRTPESVAGREGPTSSTEPELATAGSAAESTGA